MLQVRQGFQEQILLESSAAIGRSNRRFELSRSERRVFDDNRESQVVRVVKQSAGIREQLVPTGSGEQRQPITAARLYRYRNERYTRHLIGAVAVLVALSIWEGIAALNLESKLILPSPSDVWTSFTQYASTGQLGADITTSGKELILGYVAGCAAGIVLGLLIGYYRTLQYVANPFVSFSLAIPIIALAPLMIVWLGIGLLSKVAVIFLVCFFPVLLNTIGGVKNVDPHLRRMSKAFCVPDLRYFRSVAFPSSVPYILSGMRLSIGHGLIGVFVAELLGASHGVGLMMENAATDFNTARLFVGLIIFGIAGLSLTALLLSVEKHFSKWKAK